MGDRLVEHQHPQRCRAPDLRSRGGITRARASTSGRPARLVYSIKPSYSALGHDGQQQRGGGHDVTTVDTSLGRQVLGQLETALAPSARTASSSALDWHVT
jgi:hypothetical protein